MDHTTSHRSAERQFSKHQSVPPPSSYPSVFPTPPGTQAQLPGGQMAMSDPFQRNRDVFLQGGQGQQGIGGLGSRAWPPTPGLPPNAHHHQHPHPPPPQHSPPPQPTGQGQPLPPPSLGMPPPHPYDPTRRSSLSGAGSPPQYARGPLESHPVPSFPARNMPPPSPPQMPSSSHFRSAPHGPPTTSPFSGARDLASNRSGMSISSILGGNEERKPMGSPRGTMVHPLSAPQTVRPPSPGRARSSSMRESGGRGYRDMSPPRAALYREPSRASTEPRRENIFGSPPFRSEATHSFRAFQAPAQEQPQPQAQPFTVHNAPARPTSQPVDPAALRGADERLSRDAPQESRFGVFRHYGEQPTPSRMDGVSRQERTPFPNGIVPHAQERSIFTTPQAERDIRAPPLSRFQPTAFGSPLREEQAPLFRPAVSQPTSHPAPDLHHDAANNRAPDMRRQLSRPSPPPSDYYPYDRGRNGYPERPMTLEEHQRMERINSGNRKETEASVHRTILNISPDLDRKGRNSPLPQAVQGAQPRHVGPGGDNPGIKLEFGRMFSGLGSGVGSTPPIGGNGFSTPSRLSPERFADGDAQRHATADAEESKVRSKPGARGRKSGRRSREEVEAADSEGRGTPDLQRGVKRSKTNNPAHHHHHHVHAHHHHHHHHDQAEPAAGGFNMLRFPSNPPPNVGQASPGSHHHHHHHHAHPTHHHHHQPRANVPAARKPSITINNAKVTDQCAPLPRKHLGSQLYTTEVSLPPAADTPLDAKVKFSSKMKPIPFFEGKENCTFTVRVPRYYLASDEADSSGYEEICKRRQLWGTEIYSDDSDVVAAAVHSGWLQGYYGEYDEDIRDIFDNPSENPEKDDESAARLETHPKHPVKVPQGHDAHITLLILPPLDRYAGTSSHHIWSRDWDKTHDGMSFMIHSIEFVDEGPASRFTERGAAARKRRIAMEEVQRKEAADVLLMFATGRKGATGTVSVGA